MPLPTFCSRKEATTKNANTLTLTMLRASRPQIYVEEDRQRCRETLQTFNLADNVSTVLQSTHFAAPSRRIIAGDPSSSTLRGGRRILVAN